VRVEHGHARIGAMRGGERGVGVRQERPGRATRRVGEAGDPRRGRQSRGTRGARDQLVGELARLRGTGLGEEDRELASGET
jgi:hypothetical protein